MSVVVHSSLPANRLQTRPLYTYRCAYAHHTYKHKQTKTHTSTHTRTHVRTHIYIYIYSNIYIYIYVHIRLHSYLHVRTVQNQTCLRCQIAVSRIQIAVAALCSMFRRTFSLAFPNERLLHLCHELLSAKIENAEVVEGANVILLYLLRVDDV